MKKITEIAADIGVSRQAVYKKMKQEPLSTSLQEFMTTKGNTVYIEVDGENLIKSMFSKDNQTTVTTKSVDSLTTGFIASLQEQIRVLTEQNQDLREQLNQEREHSRTQADRITELAADMARLASNAQHLHAGNILPRITSGSDTAITAELEEMNQQERWGIFGLFRRKTK